MALGIGIDCKRCKEQLAYDSGFDEDIQLCNKCHAIVSFDNPERIKELEEDPNNEIKDEYYK